VEVDGETRKGVQRLEEKNYKKTGVNSTRLRQKNKDRSRYVRLYNMRSVVYKV